ncbi:MAG: carbon-nitrogen hydrolase family protein [Planctomycetaceae bacterium]|nr:carbon-nitrogen hydrolase family protein [Planctomycetaceae bacterium]
MSKLVRAAAVQMTCGPDPAANRATACRLVEEAARRGAQLVVLPELFQSLGPPARMAELAEEIPGPTSRAMGELAARLALTLVAGSIAEREPRTATANSADAPPVYNTSLLFGPDGRELARYRKQHRFDVDLPGRVSVLESAWCGAGTFDSVSATAVGRVGLAICYDLRFPELFRRLADEQLEILALPAAFAAATGRDHWEVLLRARAIENQAFIVAANQTGRVTPQLETYGHSLIVDPWGTILAEAGASEEVIVADLDFARLREIRSQLPALTHRRR